MTDRIYATMKTVEASGGNAISDGAGGHPQRIQLMHRDHPVLARGNPSDGTVPTPLGEFFRHIRKKSPTPSISPPFIAGFLAGGA
jgi:hypothetical protein